MYLFLNILSFTTIFLSVYDFNNPSFDYMYLWSLLLFSFYVLKEYYLYNKIDDLILNNNILNERIKDLTNPYNKDQIINTFKDEDDDEEDSYDYENTHDNTNQQEDKLINIEELLTCLQFDTLEIQNKNIIYTDIDYLLKNIDPYILYDKRYTKIIELTKHCENKTTIMKLILNILINYTFTDSSDILDKLLQILTKKCN